MTDSRRFGFRIFAAALVLLLVVFGVTWMVTAPNEPPPSSVTKSPVPSKRKDGPAATAAPGLPPPAPRDPKAIDPEIQGMADRLAAKSESPPRDLEIVNDFIELYRKVFKEGNPIGLNEDITAALTGHNSKEGILFPPGNPMIVKGQLVDRWGTPYWFHPNTSYQMEIRSAGPDKNLFTPDDVVINPGPDNMGIGVAKQ